MFLCKILFLLPILHLSVGVDGDLADSFKKAGIVPKMFPKAPKNLLNVAFSKTAKVNLGNNLTNIQAAMPPEVDYAADPQCYYTILMFGPPNLVPGVLPHLPYTFLHWCLGNIKESDLASGDLVAPYFLPTPVTTKPPFHYVVLLYKQAGKTQFDLKDFVATEKRAAFDVPAFAKKHNLGDPISGNFFIGLFIDQAVSNFLGQIKFN